MRKCKECKKRHAIGKSVYCSRVCARKAGSGTSNTPDRRRYKRDIRVIARAKKTKTGKRLWKHVTPSMIRAIEGE